MPGLKAGAGTADDDPMDALDPAPAGSDAVRGGYCPACSARCAPDAPWCSLCFADLRPVPASAATSPPVDAPAAPSPKPDAEAREAPGEATGEATGEALQRPAAHPAPRVPLVSDLLAGPGGPVAVMLGGTVLVGGAAVALMWLVGALL